MMSRSLPQNPDPDDVSPGSSGRVGGGSGARGLNASRQSCSTLVIGRLGSVNIPVIKCRQYEALASKALLACSMTRFASRVDKPAHDGILGIHSSHSLRSM